ncbi:universal stress protein [Fulvivirga sp. 29W222]|uniref:Universal stress protein n=1 Tax=Fulvivirga marina TaxID=2494733 RepID=A0A937FWT1_9BACT|nr:universal stress protein [Fulvivirga marina]MBL6446127.1 universal stress protein [Fulvivirga marina]
MYQVKRLLVGLDLSEMDEKLISYTSGLVKLFGVEMVYFFHVAKSFDLPKKLIEKYPDLVAPVDEALERDIREKVKKHFTATCDFQVAVREGNAEDKILRFADLKEIDLMVMGRKQELKGQGVLPGRLAKTIHCSVLLVPENATDRITKILVPVDFSKTSSMALDEAVFIKKSTGADILLHNSYRVPSGYHLSGKSYEEFGEIMKSNAYEDAVEFLQRSELKASDVEIELTLDEHDDPAELSYALAKEKNADLIVIGSKGRTGLASILLGSVADKMIQYDSNIPLIVIKDKKANLDFLQALLKL